MPVESEMTSSSFRLKVPNHPKQNDENDRSDYEIRDIVNEKLFVFIKPTD